MAKFYGMIGFVKTVEDPPDSSVYKQVPTERPYSGDLMRNSRELQPSNQVNDNITISNQISIVADPYANDNLDSMCYVVLRGKKWKIKTAEVQYPRIIISIGGLYNG